MSSPEFRLGGRGGKDVWLVDARKCAAATVLALVAVVMLVWFAQPLAYDNVRHFAGLRGTPSKTVVVNQVAHREELHCEGSKMKYNEAEKCLDGWRVVGDTHYVAPPWRTNTDLVFSKVGMFLGDFSKFTNTSTIWLTAQEKGGSSLATVALKQLGVMFHLPDDILLAPGFDRDSDSIWDLCKQATEAVGHPKLSQQLARDVKAVATRRDRHLAAWGAKQVTHPYECIRAGHPELHTHLRNLRIIIVFRDVAGVLGRWLRKDHRSLSKTVDKIGRRDFDERLTFTVDRQLQLVELLKWAKTMKYPTYLVGLSRIMKDPQGFLEDLEVFTGRRYSSYCEPLQIIQGGDYIELCR
eukprot:TRINITY_DN2302_c0_g1_i1.p1 TRINITY_DN2302_c0_g1~~TRINITY_DN2302_c0_g1_i1.p1  ORF type:complete len:353 (+),score=63.83 TRINITY_DN2302_c0_g1_i1:148-1206(+)